MLTEALGCFLYFSYFLKRSFNFHSRDCHAPPHWAQYFSVNHPPDISNAAVGFVWMDLMRSSLCGCIPESLTALSLLKHSYNPAAAAAFGISLCVQRFDAQLPIAAPLASHCTPPRGAATPAKLHQPWASRLIFPHVLFDPLPSVLPLSSSSHLACAIQWCHILPVTRRPRLPCPRAPPPSLLSL